MCHVPSVVEVWSLTLVGVVLVLAIVVLIIHVLGLLSSLSLRLFGIPCVHALGFSKLVDFTTDEASEEFLGKGVGDGFA